MFLDLSQRAFHFYKSGVFDTICSGKKLDHAVIAVGYSDKDNHEGYWLLKNSWGGKFQQNYVI